MLTSIRCLMDVTVAEGDTYDFAGHTAQVFETPGHTTGHISFYFADSDALFAHLGEAVAAYHRSHPEVDFILNRVDQGQLELRALGRGAHGAMRAQSGHLQRHGAEAGKALTAMRQFSKRRGIVPAQCIGQRLGDNKQFKNTETAFVAALIAGLTAWRVPVPGVSICFMMAQPAAFQLIRLIGLFAVITQPPNQPLRNNGPQCRGYQIRRGAHINQSQSTGYRVIGMQG